jgi:hypothetical protein
MNNITSINLEDLQRIFFPHFLEIQIARRKEAIVLFGEKKFHEIYKNYIHYLVRESKTIPLSDDNDIDSVIDELKDIKNDLPDNSSNVILLPYTHGGLYISYIVNSIEEESVCTSLANHLARDAAWKMKYQLTGKDGQAALKLYNKLIEKN